jgi:glycosidase
VPQLAYWQGGHPNADGFDSHLPSIMDFPLRDAIVKGVPEDRVNWNEGLTRIYDALSHDFVYHDLSHMMIFAANHDTERIGSIVRANPDRMKMISVLLATLRGIPQTYYGDELMFLNTNDRGDSAWRCEFSGGWEGDADNLFTQEGRSDVQNDLFDFNSRLWNWRKTSEAIHHGRTLHFLTRDNTYAYFRYLPSADDKAIDKAVFVFINNSTEVKHVPWSYYDELTPRLGSAAKDVLTGQSVTLSDATVVPAGKTLVVEFSK